MNCYEGFNPQEALDAGICSECPKRHCSHNPAYQSWRAELGFRSARENKEKEEVWQPTQVVRGRCVSSYNRNGLKKLSRDVSQISRRALKVMAECAETILHEENLKYGVRTKKGVWATYCRISSFRESFVQFGEGAVILHYSGIGADTVRNEMKRFGWRWSTEEGWLMTVIHEVAHALHKERGTGGSSHGFQFHQCLKELRARYFERLLPKFKGIIFEEKIVEEKIAANSRG